MNQLCLFPGCLSKQNYITYKHKIRDSRSPSTGLHIFLTPHWYYSSLIRENFSMHTTKRHSEKGSFCRIHQVGRNVPVGSLFHRMFKELEEIQFMITCIILVGIIILIKVSCINTTATSHIAFSRSNLIAIHSLALVFFLIECNSCCITMMLSLIYHRGAKLGCIET